MADTIYYINRLKYLGGPEIFRDSMPYYRNFSSILNNHQNLVTDFRGIPSNVLLTESMGLGHNSADSQWVYAHFVASNSVTIKPGFKVASGSSMRITVSTAGQELARRAPVNPDKMTSKPMTASNDDGLKLKYDAATYTISLSFNSERSSNVVVSVYNLKGERVVERVFSKDVAGTFSASLSAKDLPNGIYAVRVFLGRSKLQKQFVKW